VWRRTRPLHRGSTISTSGPNPRREVGARPFWRAPWTSTATPPRTDWDRGADEIVGAGGNDLLYLAAQQWDGSILVQWVTRNETPGVRFRLSRARSGDGPWQPVAKRDIEGLVASSGNTSYFYRDAVGSDETHYLLELVKPEGVGTNRQIRMGFQRRHPRPDAGRVEARSERERPSSTESLDRQPGAFCSATSTTWTSSYRRRFAATVTDDVFFASGRRGPLAPRSLPFRVSNLAQGLRSGEVTLNLARSQNSELAACEATERCRPPRDAALARILRVQPRGGEARSVSSPLRWNGEFETLNLSDASSCTSRSGRLRS
jgi:hypothetical protein